MLLLLHTSAQVSSCLPVHGEEPAPSPALSEKRGECKLQQGRDNPLHPIGAK